MLGLQELRYQQAQPPQAPNDTFVSVASQFLTVASFSYSDVEDLFSEAKDVVITTAFLSCLHNTNLIWCWSPAQGFFFLIGSFSLLLAESQSLTSDFGFLPF